MNFNKVLSEIPHLYNLTLFSYIRSIILHIIHLWKVYFDTFIPIQLRVFKAASI